MGCVTAFLNNAKLPVQFIKSLVMSDPNMLNLFHTRKNCKCLNNKLLQQAFGHAYAGTEWRWRQLLTIRKPAVEAGGWSAPRSGSFTPGKDLEPVIQEAWVARLGFTGNLTNKDSIAGPPVRDGTQYRCCSSTSTRTTRMLTTVTSAPAELHTVFLGFEGRRHKHAA